MPVGATKAALEEGRPYDSGTWTYGRAFQSRVVSCNEGQFSVLNNWDFPVLKARAREDQKLIFFEVIHFCKELVQYTTLWYLLQVKLTALYE